MRKCRLKVREGGKTLTHDEYTGFAFDPVAGCHFYMVMVEPNDHPTRSKDLRTSKVREVEEHEPFDGSLFHIRTRNSSYEITFLEERQDGQESQDGTDAEDDPDDASAGGQGVAGSAVPPTAG